MSFNDRPHARPTAQATERSTPEQIAKARAVITRNARDPEDCHLLLEALDLLPADAECEREAS